MLQDLHALFASNKGFTVRCSTPESWEATALLHGGVIQ